MQESGNIENKNNMTGMELIYSCREEKKIISGSCRDEKSLVNIEKGYTEN